MVLTFRLTVGHDCATDSVSDTVPRGLSAFDIEVQLERIRSIAISPVVGMQEFRAEQTSTLTSLVSLLTVEVGTAWLQRPNSPVRLELRDLHVARTQRRVHELATHCIITLGRAVHPNVYARLDTYANALNHCLS